MVIFISFRRSAILYTNPTFEDNVAVPTFGNANLNPEKTVTYEMGLQQQLTEDVAFNVTGFYKDVRDLLALQQIRVSSSYSYYTYVNKDYGNIKGITFSLTKRKFQSSLFALSIDYTFQVAEGNETSASAFFLDAASGRQSEKIPVPLDWDQSHTLNGVISFGDRYRLAVYTSSEILAQVYRILRLFMKNKFILNLIVIENHFRPMLICWWKNRLILRI